MSAPVEAPPVVERSELAAWARVIKPALCLLLQFWAMNERQYPPAHPYRQAATMFLRFLEARYGV